MIYSTVIPHEIVWDGFNALEKKEYKELTMGHMTMVVEQISPNQAQIVRLISPNPQDYTRLDLAPGSIIDFFPSLNTNDPI